MSTAARSPSGAEPPAAAAPQPRGEPPGPPGAPFFGCLGELRRSPMRFSTRVAQTYGGIARIPLGRRCSYLVSDPELLRELLHTRRDCYMKNVRYRQIQDLLGLGLLLAEGEVWKRQREICQPEFTLQAVDRQTSWKAEAAARYLEGWAPRADSGEAFDVMPEFFHLAQLLVGEMILGPHFQEVADRFCRYATELKESWPRAPRSLLGDLLPPPVFKLRRFRKALAALDALIYDFLEARRRHDFDGTGIVTTLMRASTVQGDPFSDRNLRDQIMTLFFAGHETSATALCWIHYLLSRHPEVRQRLAQEVHEELGDRQPTPEDLKRLTYTHQVVSESLRLYSPIHSISRVAIEENALGGYRIPKGSTVVVSLFATHRLSQYWPDPERFDPDRFLPAAVAARPAYSYIPFAAGHRNCIGGTMAVIELRMIVAQLAQRYRLELLPGHPIEPEAGTTMYPRYGMKMTLHRAAAP